MGTLLFPVVVFAADVFVTNRLGIRRGLKEQGLLVQAVFEDGFNVLVGIGLDGKRPATGLLYPFGTP
jgi:hypothetical protein